MNVAKNIEPDLNQGEAGFTLIEVLISLFIFALISVGTMSALTQTLRGKARLDAAVSGINNLNSARAIMRADMASITLRPLRDELGGILPYSLTTDGEALLTFVRRGRSNPGGLEARGDLERVEYIFEDARLVRRSFSHENPSSDPQYFDSVLLSDIEDIKLRAHERSQSSGIVSTAGLTSFASEQIRIPSPTFTADDPQTPGLQTLPPQAISFEIVHINGSEVTHYFELSL